LKVLFKQQKPACGNSAREQTHVGSRYTWKTHMRATRRVNIYLHIFSFNMQD